MKIDWNKIRKDFVILNNGLVYLDNSATSQKPLVVIEAIEKLYKEYNANIHRGVYKLSEETSQKYIESKNKVASFINAQSYEEIIYTRNATEGLNIAALILEKKINAGDEILVSIMEHHSNIIPWQKVCERKNAKLKFIETDSEGNLDIESIESQISEKTKVVAITHASNVLGTINPVKYISEITKKFGAYFVVDGAQAVGSIKVDIKEIDCDFYSFSGHKMLGPTGIGVLFAKKELLENNDPIYFGGDMVSRVQKYSIDYKELPWKFEAGTSNYEGGICLGVAIDYINEIGIDNINERKNYLKKLAEESLSKLEELRIFGNVKDKLPIFSFAYLDIHPHDIASLLDRDNICIRAGNHCAQPLIDYLNEGSLARASFQFYNNEEDIQNLINGLNRVKEFFKNGR